ncbi:MAG: hypothetical protein ACOC24_03255 [Desulfovibrionales bacterium]
MRPLLESVGFVDVLVEIKPQSREIISSWNIRDAEKYAVSAYILARKPAP